MKLFQFFGFTRTLAFALVSIISLYGLTSITVANAGKPIPVDVNSVISIFPDGYLPVVEGGTDARLSCVRDRADLSSLTCTANDVGLANISVPSGAPETCTAGEVVTQNLNFEVVSTANIRYNWAFYTTTDPETDPLEGPGDACLIWVGDVTDEGPLNSQIVNGDSCTDVTKSQDAVFTNEVITFLCEDTDGDTFVDLDYCATWSQRDDALCSDGIDGEINVNWLPVPGAPSKCNCETVTIPITVLPDAPTLSITPTTQSRLESDIYVGSDTFVFALNINNANASTSLIISELTHYFDGVDYDIPGAINVSPGALSENQVVLISATDTSGTCLDSGTQTILPGQTYICNVTFRWKSLALTDTEIGGDVREDKINNFEAEWAFASASAAPVGPSNNVTASIADVAPILTIAKTALPTSIPETGNSGFDLVDYTVTFGNDSGWDTIYISTSSPDNLSDTLVQNNVLITDQGGKLTGCDISGLDFGESPTCDYAVNLATIFTINSGDNYKNTVYATPTDEEGTSGNEVDHFANVGVSNINPMVTLKKYVRSGTSTSTTIAEYNDISTSVGEYELADLTNAPTVTYLFVVSNESFESFVITDFVDFAVPSVGIPPYSTTPPAQSYDAQIADTTPVEGECASLIGVTLPVGGSAKCTLSFKVAGDESEQVDNIAWVLVEDLDPVPGLDFATDPAVVLLEPVSINLALGVDLSATITVTVDAANTNVEPILFNPYLDFLVYASDGTSVDDYPIFTTGFSKFVISNNDCDSIDQSLLPDDSPYTCSFDITKNGVTALGAAIEVIQSTLKVRGRDNDGEEKTLQSTITVKATAPSI